MKKKVKDGLVTTLTSNGSCKIVEAHSGTTRNLTTGEILAIMSFGEIDLFLSSPPDMDFKPLNPQLKRETIGNAKFKHKG